MKHSLSYENIEQKFHKNKRKNARFNSLTQNIKIHSSKNKLNLLNRSWDNQNFTSHPRVQGFIILGFGFPRPKSDPKITKT